MTQNKLSLPLWILAICSVFLVGSVFATGEPIALASADAKFYGASATMIALAVATFAAMPKREEVSR